MYRFLERKNIFLRASGNEKIKLPLMLKLLPYLFITVALCHFSPAADSNEQAGRRGRGPATPDEMIKKQCRSVHVTHGAMPAQCKAIYIEATAEKSARGTYFSACNFDDGYIGFQELMDGKKIVIFSIWDPKAYGDNPNAVPEEDRVQLVKAGENINASRFGGEGTGGKSMGELNWKEKEKLKFLVTITPSKVIEHYKIISGYVWKGGQWKLISSWRTSQSPRELSRATSFVEDFARNYESTKHERSALYGPCYVLDKEGKWLLMDEGYFTADSPALSNHILAEAVDARHAFRIATGGKLETGAWKLNESKKITAAKATVPTSPGKDVDKIINAPVEEPALTPAKE